MLPLRIFLFVAIVSFFAISPAQTSSALQLEAESLRERAEIVLKRRIDGLLSRIKNLEGALAEGPQLKLAAPRIPVGGVAEIDDLAPGRWLEYGAPWNNIAKVYCQGIFADVLDAWTSGALDDQGNLWLATPGGHSNGCNQQVYRYNIDAGRPEVIAGQLPHNFVESDVPYSDVDGDGNPDQPCSTHNYNGLHIIKGYLYRSSSVCFPWKPDNQVWRFNMAAGLTAADPVAANDAWERLPNHERRFHGQYNRMAVLDDGLTVAGWQGFFCEFDWQTGRWSACQNDKWGFDNSRAVIYGKGDTVWAVTNTRVPVPKLRELRRNDPGDWTEVRTVAPDPIKVGAGACIVSTPAGDVPIFYTNQAQLTAWLPSGELVQLDAPDGPGARAARKPYGKWAWSERFGVCIGADDVASGLWIYRPDIAVLTGAAPEPEPVGDTTLFFDDFEGDVFIAGKRPRGCASAAAKCGYGDWLWNTNSKTDHTTGPNLVDGALRFDIPDKAWAASAGFYQVNFIEGLTKPFGPGDSLEVQFNWRASCDLIYTNCDPKNEGYKATRRAYPRKSGGHTSFKIMILGTGDHPQIPKPTNSCTAQEMVLTHYFDHALTGYHACGWFVGFSEPSKPSATVPNYSWDAQPNGVGSCPSNYENKAGKGIRTYWNKTSDNCIRLDSDVWHEISMQVDIGEYQGAGDQCRSPKSNVRVFLDGQKIIDHALCIQKPEDPRQGFGKLWLLPYMTDKDPAKTHPAAWVEYDNVRVCSPTCEAP